MMDDLFSYTPPAPAPSAPFARGSATSEAAADSIRPTLPFLQRKVLDTLLAHPLGLTCEEVEDSADLSHQTASARIRELVQSRLIETTGDRRPTRSGRGANVYVAREGRA